MSRHARIEDVDDDPDDFDIADYDPRNRIVDPSEIPERYRQTRPTNIPPSAPKAPPKPAAQPPFAGGPGTQFISESESAQFKGYQIVYPIYFDITRSREEGRRVNKQYAVENPLAREIVDCCNINGLQTVFEPTKTHPKDWANPGRVRILLKEDGTPRHAKIKNKRQLLQIIGAYLKAHPANESTPLRLRFPNMPNPDKPPPPPAIPRGWKMNTILPMHSAGVTGGGVSDNILKDMMAEMGGAGGPPGGMAGLANLSSMFGGGGGMPSLEAGPSSAGGEGKKKKEKKGKK